MSQELLCGRCARWTCDACRERLAHASRKGSFWRSIHAAMVARAEKLEQAAKVEPDISGEMKLLAGVSLLIGAVTFYLIHIVTSIFLL